VLVWLVLVLLGVFVLEALELGGVFTVVVVVDAVPGMHWEYHYMRVTLSMDMDALHCNRDIPGSARNSNNQKRMSCRQT
jgi:hypothetical protein